MNKNLLIIDPNNLDRGWIDQAPLVFEYGEKLANARDELRGCTSELDLIRAELEKNIMEDPGTFGVPKVTVSAVASCILMQKEYQMALQTVHKKQHEVSVLDAFVLALDHKKRGLQSMVSLHGQEYFAEPRADVSNQRSIEDAIKRKVRKGRARERVS
jgi:hypothetical protein